MDQQAATLLALLKRTGAPSEAKLNQLNALKSDIKHYRVPETAQATIFDCLRIAITQTASSTLASTSFSTLSHLVKRLKIQDASGHSITQLAPRILPILQERLGDHREQHRQAASQALTELYPFLQSEIEHIIREEAIPGTNPRAKEAAMRWVVRAHQEENMPFKSYVGPIVGNLEDADPSAREAAKKSLVDLFGNASDRAKADLKKQLKAYSIRHAIEAQVLAAIGNSSSGAASGPQAGTGPEVDLAASTRSLPALDHIAHFQETINSEAAKPPPPEEVPMDPIYIGSSRDLEDVFREMLPHFQGKEEEGNWVQRDKSVLKLRRILKGNAPSQFHVVFLTGLNSVMEGILKVANSLRTTVSSNGCQLVQELAKTLGPALDKHAEILLQNFIKTSAATKPIAAQNGRITSDMLFQHVSYNVRLVQHIWSAAQDKNAQTRQYATGWLQTILNREAGYKHRFDTSGGAELAIKCIEKGLNDANPKVKEGSRASFWIFHKTWPEKADHIMSKLDAKSKSLLEKDSNNPNAALFNSGSSSVSGARPAAVAGPRSTLKEQIAAQRKAKMAAHQLPSRPNSAMAELSPVKHNARLDASAHKLPPSQLRVSQRPEGRVASQTADVTSSTTTTTAPTKSGSSLMSGPVRRPRRAEPPRPQTADPYSSRRLLRRPETPVDETPEQSPEKGTSISKSSVLEASSSRRRSRTTANARSNIGSPGKSPRSNRIAQPGRPSSKGSDAPTREDLSGMVEDLTLVLPNRNAHSPTRQKRPDVVSTVSAQTGMHNKAEDEDFTMVLPTQNRGFGNRLQSPPASRPGSSGTSTSPLKQMFAEARRLASDEHTRPGSSRSTQLDRAPTAIENGLSISRKSSPVKSVTPQPSEVQIYEDPFTGSGSTPVVEGERQVLGELPVNENVRVQSPTQSVGSSNSPDSPQQPNGVNGARSPQPASATPSQDRAETIRNRRLLGSGIERIRAKTLDAHGFRRVQDLVKSKSDIWGTDKYDELMAVLLEYLQTFDADAKLAQQSAAKALGLKAQAMGLLKVMLTVHKKSAQSWYARSLVALVVIRPGIEIGSHLLTDLERAADEVVKVAPSDACIDALVDYLQQSASPDDEAGTSSRSTTLALAILRNLLATNKSRDADLDASRRSVVAQTTIKYLDNSDAEVRKASVDLGAELFDVVGDDKQVFWREFKGVDEGRLGLLTYYTARKVMQ